VENPKVDLAQIVKQFGKSLVDKNNLSGQQTKVLHNIINCRTAVLGGHKEACDKCGVIRYSYDSCGDRHCPKCQLAKQAKWVEKLQDEALPVKHYHIIFTVPHGLNQVSLWRPKLYYNLLFKCVWDTLRSFGYTHFGVESGAIAVLHTWGQNLSVHPHIHCMVPATGFSLKGKWKRIGKNDKYLYPVKQLSATFKGKFLDGLKQKLQKMNHLGFEQQIQKAYQSKWVVYCEAPMAGVNQVIKYLGQYTHRIAISNQRIRAIKDGRVYFHAKDYRDNATIKMADLDGLEFLHRFTQHILPKGFIRIRRYGIYNATVKRNLNIAFAAEQTGFNKLMAKKEKQTQATMLEQARCCPVCKKGRMIVMEKLPRIRSPTGHLPTMLRRLLN
jgi:hypothetical protein